MEFEEEGNEMKKAGFDGILIEGHAPEPVYLWVHDGNVEIRNASSLWGQGTHQTGEMLQKIHGDDYNASAAYLVPLLMQIILRMKPVISFGLEYLLIWISTHKQLQVLPVQFISTSRQEDK
jgi:hypothetical protein